MYGWRGRVIDGWGEGAIQYNEECYYSGVTPIGLERLLWLLEALVLLITKF